MYYFEDLIELGCEARGQEPWIFHEKQILDPRRPKRPKPD